MSIHTAFPKYGSCCCLKLFVQYMTSWRVTIFAEICYCTPYSKQLLTRLDNPSFPQQTKRHANPPNAQKYLDKLNRLNSRRSADLESNTDVIKRS